jgi:hypothetical protein
MRRLIAAASAVVSLSVAVQSQAALIGYTTILTGPGESPPNASPGSGMAFVDVDTAANTMRVRLTFVGLLGTSTAAHLHAPTAVPLTGTAAVATQTPSFAGFPLGVTSGSTDQTLDLTQAATYNPAYVAANGGTPAGAEAALLAAMAGGQSYLDIHTTVVPGGEIRGFLVPVPEPTSLGLTASAGLLLALRRRRRMA